MRAKVKLSVALLGLALLGTALGSPAANAADARFEGSSADGSVVFFSTTDQLVPGDTDSKVDVYERSFDPAVGEGGAYVTREVSTGPTGGNDAYDASYQGSSADGAAVFFSTQEPLVAADRDRSVDVYRHDHNGGTTLVSQAASSCEAGSCGNGAVAATFKGMTPDGKKVFFETNESLTPEDTDGAGDVYMRDLESEPPTTILVSRAAASCAVGGCGNGPEPATFAGVSDNGKKVFFETNESLTPADTDGAGDVYLRNLASEPPTTTLVSLGGVCPEGASASECKPKFRAASGDGSRAFFTTSERISGADTDSSSDVYVWQGGAISLVSIGPSGGNGATPATFAGASNDGAKVFFQTGESLTPGDTDVATDVYVRDLEGEPPTTTLVTRAASSCVAGGCGNGPDNATFAGASTSGERAFFQTSESLAPADEDSVGDVYVRDLGEATTTLVSQPAPACAGGSCGPAGPALFAGASASGGSAFFTSEEAFVPADVNEAGDVYGRDLLAASTSLESPGGICPLAEEKGCDATFAGASEDGARVFFRTAERLTAEDVDSDLDVYERAEGKTRLVSAGNSVSLGPATPVLTATNPASPGGSLTPSIVGHADPETSIKIYTTSDCSGEVVAGTVAQLEGAGIPMSVEAGSTTSFRATATDEHGDTSGCSNAVVYKQENPPPPGEESGGGGGGSGGGGGGGGPTAVPAPGPTAPAPTHGGIAYVAPMTRITFGPASKTRASRPVFRFVDSTGQPGTRFVCKIDRRGWKSCASPIRLGPVSAGKHVFEVKGINAVGAPEVQPVKRSFKRVSR